MVYGLWFMVYGLWFMVYGLWFMDNTPLALVSDDEFLELVQQQIPAIHQMLRQYRLNADDIADIVQNTMIAAYIGKKRFTPDAPLIIWLIKIARHQLYNWIRSEKRKGNRNPLRMELSELNEEEYAGARRKEEFLEIMQYDLSQLLSALPADVQELILLIYIQGRSYEELAAEWNCTASSLKMRVRRGLDTMRGIVRKEEMWMEKQKKQG